MMSDIAKARDEHFVKTQNSVGSALSALSAAISLIINDPKDSIDQEILTKYLASRRSYITPILPKSLKSMADNVKTDEWLYGTKFAEQLKEIHSVETACAKLKAANKNVNTNKTQGNFRNPPAKYKQVGAYQRRPIMNFKPRTNRYYPKTQKITPTATGRSSNPKSSKK
ncbi:hypothetical protein PUN28_019689 [Cardiocondyla obscurior]|uniref:Uncharacterized protein n=1 Tax=Cardiocondyla obscurior TaxID=286306 RepID=A0AAW2EA31_9HYME